MEDAWKKDCAEARQALMDSIPPKWRLSNRPSESQTDVRSVPRTCGLLTERQLEITEQNASDLMPKLLDGRLSSAEVTEAFCARAAIAHQCDIFHMKGKMLTMGFAAWHNNKSDQDAAIIEILRNAGAVFYVRTTMPQTGMFLETWSNLWGRTVNPYNTAFSAGGSSGGDGSLVAMRGAPFCPSTDIGGSIRAPAAFNGNYAIRPTGERTARRGMGALASGQISVKVSSGPNCHSMGDIKMASRVLLTHYGLPFETTAIPIPWKDVAPKNGKLCFGLMATDGCVEPHPPIRRALRETEDKLRAAGHEVIGFSPPFDCWEVADTTWRLWFQTGAKECKSLVASAGEPLYPTYTWYLDTFNIQPLSVPELFKLNTKQSDYRYKFAEAWYNTKFQTGTGRPIDALICPCGPSSSFPHGFPVWWGYFSLWNILDYPSIVVPLKDFHVDLEKDGKDLDYHPRENVFDKMNHDIYDPKLWDKLPVTIQVVGRQFEDEELIAVTECLDQVCND
ncbi:uncharacterized protein PV07_00918 [Cladophialophora immunda]|uniref:Amidase domain-containing protein n=1 Tax=Cladophialophora immunda TaxID=569365 RepID=A0A0D2B932_9EURO|nr:uncharacterized protein PV07_00918 [Cladophialophora immunda]KIW34122.1 hypothetical protein PV07_00918 [Cladophialophora immunda]